MSNRPSRYVKRSAAMLILRPESLIANWTDVGGLNPFLREQVSPCSALSVPTVALNGDRDLATFTSAIRTVRGSAVPMKTPIDC
jgi:hypothetical protein